MHSTKNSECYQAQIQALVKCKLRSVFKNGQSLISLIQPRCFEQVSPRFHLHIITSIATLNSSRPQNGFLHSSLFQNDFLHSSRRPRPFLFLLFLLFLYLLSPFSLFRALLYVLPSHAPCVPALLASVSDAALPLPLSPDVFLPLSPSGALVFLPPPVSSGLPHNVYTRSTFGNSFYESDTG